MKKLFLIGLSSAFLFGSVYAATPNVGLSFSASNQAEQSQKEGESTPMMDISSASASACAADVKDGLNQATTFIQELQGLELSPGRSGIGVAGGSLLAASGGVTSMILTAAIDDQLNAGKPCDTQRQKTLYYLFQGEKTFVASALMLAQ